MNASVHWATRCNACGTSFRVNEEQLRVSDGYVRCGRCDAVFNARNTMFALGVPEDAPTPPGRGDAPLPPAAQTADHEAAPMAQPQDAPSPARPAPLAPDHREPDPPSMWLDTESQVLDPADLPPEDFASSAEAVWEETRIFVTERDRVEPQWEPEAATPAPVAPEQATARMQALLAESKPPKLPKLPKPPKPKKALLSGFSWPSLARLRPAPPTVARAGFALGAVLAASLTLALPLHWAWIEQEALRAKIPQWDALLRREPWPALGVQGWRHLEGLRVVGSTLQAAPQGAGYVLELSLHNKAPHALAMPWLDLSLSNAKGELLVRRALGPVELGASPVMASGEQRKVKAVMRLQGRAEVAGYELGLFHP
jgi:predicted Zn finger-like uncharacterized protein